MTTIKVGSQDAEGFHPDGSIVDPAAVEEFISGSASLAAKLAVKANAASLAAKLDKTEAAATYVKFVDQNGAPLAGKHVTIKVDSATGEILDIISEA